MYIKIVKKISLTFIFLTLFTPLTSMAKDGYTCMNNEEDPNFCTPDSMTAFDVCSSGVKRCEL